jgi:Fe-S cluster assembly iron-binding protein IscA
MTIEKQGVGLVVDPMSLQYLVGGASIIPKVWKARVLS